MAKIDDKIYGKVEQFKYLEHNPNKSKFYLGRN
jgi:hypothetical protein